MALASIELLCTIPISTYIMAINISVGLSPYKGWADLHFNYSHVNQIPSVIWHLDKTLAICLELARWLVVACALIFFGFFGFAEEARRHYRSAFQNMAKRLPAIPCFTPRRKQKSAILPQYVFILLGMNRMH